MLDFPGDLQEIGQALRGVKVLLMLTMMLKTESKRSTGRSYQQTDDSVVTVCLTVALRFSGASPSSSSSASSGLSADASMPGVWKSARKLCRKAWSTVIRFVGSNSSIAFNRCRAVLSAPQKRVRRFCRE
jgi:hypothetical protein